MNSNESNEDMMMFTMDPEISDDPIEKKDEQPLDASLNQRKMFDITELLGSTSFDDEFESISANFHFDEQLPTETSKNVEIFYGKLHWEIEENRSKPFDSKQISPNEFSREKLLDDRPMTLEKDISTSFEQHRQFIEYLNETNDYPSYLNYLNENRLQLFYTLTESSELLDGLLGTIVSSF